MPRTNMCKPSRLVEIETMVRESCKKAEYAGAADVGRIVGTSKYGVIYDMMAGYPVTLIGKRKKWRVGDIAKALYERETTA